jgi:hypothetical protein
LTGKGILANFLSYLNRLSTVDKKTGKEDIPTRVSEILEKKDDPCLY